MRANSAMVGRTREGADDDSEDARGLADEGDDDDESDTCDATIDSASNIFDRMMARG